MLIVVIIAIIVYEYQWLLTRAMHGPIEQHDEEMIVNSIIRLL